MRNGIYRVWYNNADGEGTASVILADGQLIACDRTHTFLGRYHETNGWFTASLEIRRHRPGAGRPEFPRADIFQMDIAGASTNETIAARGTYPDQPGRVLDVKFVWCCEI